MGFDWSCGNGGGGGGGGGGPPGDLAGRVCAPDGETWLSHAIVWLDANGTRYETQTDSDGRWQLSDVPSGTWTLHIEKGSFSTTVEVTVDEEPVGTVQVTKDDLYTLARIPGDKRDHVLDLSFSSGTEAYAFTFG